MLPSKARDILSSISFGDLPNITSSATSPSSTRRIKGFHLDLFSCFENLCSGERSSADKKRNDTAHEYDRSVINQLYMQNCIFFAS